MSQGARRHRGSWHRDHRRHPGRHPHRAPRRPGGPSIKVTFADGTSSAASIKSSDPTHDIAVLTPRQPPSVIVPEVLGGSAQIGDQAFAVGNPLGLVASLVRRGDLGARPLVPAGRRAHADRDDPVRRRCQPGQLRWPVAQWERSGDRYRDRPRQRRGDREICRHRLRRPDRHRRWCRRSAAR